MKKHLNPRTDPVHALQKYKMEEGLLPSETGEPGGDRLERLREIHALIDIGGGKQASEYSTIRMMVYPKIYEYNENNNLKTPLDENYITLISQSP